MSKNGDLLIVGERKIVPVVDIRPNKFNYNKQSAFIYDKMLTSLKEFGFVDPIDVRSGNEDGEFGYYEVIGGEHRLRAATELGYTEVPVNDLGIITDSAAKKLCIVLNETKGKPDNDALASLVADLAGEGVDLSVLPYDESEIDAFIELTDVDVDDLLDLHPETSDDNEASLPKPKEETIISVMGLLEITKKKEKYLIEQFRRAMNVMNLQDKPTRCLEKLLDGVVEG